MSAAGHYRTPPARRTQSATWLSSLTFLGAAGTVTGSNFPLEKLHASYADFFAVYRKVLSEYSEADQRKVFNDNAGKFYRL